MRKSFITFLVLLIMAVMSTFSFAGGPDTKTIWCPDHDGDIQIVSDDGFTPSTFTIKCKLRVDDSLMLEKLQPCKQIWHAPVVASSVGVYAVNITTETLNAKTSTWAETKTLVFSPARTLGASMSMTTLASNNGVSQASNTVSCTIQYIGYNAKGQYISEVVVASLCATVNYTNNAFARVTSTVVSALTHTGTDSQQVWSRVTINLATGVKLGLCADITSTNDIFQVMEGTQPIRVSDTALLTFDVTYDTVDFVTDQLAAVNPKEILFMGGSYRP